MLYTCIKRIIFDWTVYGHYIHTSGIFYSLLIRKQVKMSNLSKSAASKQPSNLPGDNITEKPSGEQHTQTPKNNKMGTMPVNRLLITMSVPMMISMLVQALYNIVDSMFVAHVSEDALTALSYAFPLQTLMIAVGVGTAVGVNAILSKALGAKDYDRANKVAVNGIFLSVISFLVFMIIGFTFVGPFYRFQTSNQDIITYGTDYLSIVMCISIGIFLQTMFERLLTSTGRTLLTMCTQGTGALINIILDPILIFGYCGMPKLGVKGAAIATVVGQIVAAVFALILNLKKNPEIKISFKGFKPSGEIIRTIYVIGLPSIIMQSIGSVMVFLMNRILGAINETAVTVFGVYFKLQSFIFMPIFGLNSGLVPIIAYNYGARKKDRLMKAWKLAWFYATAIMLIGVAAFELMPKLLLQIFKASDNLLLLGTPALRIIGIHFPVAAFCIVTGTLFQALGKSVYSMVTSIMRQLVVLLPAAYLLSLSQNVDLVWWSFPIAEVMSAAVTIIYFIRINKKIIQKL